jgi:hypothetical protein
VTLRSGFDVLIPVFSFLTIVLFDIKRLSYAVSFQTSYEAGIVQSVCHKATGWMVRGSNAGKDKTFSVLKNRLWDPPSLIFNAYRRLFLRIYGPERELIARLHLVPTLMREAIFILPLYAFMSWGGGGWVNLRLLFINPI